MTPPGVASAVREEIEALYDAYVEALDGGELERWPELFTERCLYLVIPRDNHDRGLPLATLRCESRGMLQDRVVALRRTAMYAPRYVRHLVGRIAIRAAEDRPSDLAAEADAYAACASYAVFETRVETPTEILAVGRYEDVIVRETGALRFREKRCIQDSIVVPNSLVYPI